MVIRSKRAKDWSKSAERKRGEEIKEGGKTLSAPTMGPTGLIPRRVPF